MKLSSLQFGEQFRIRGLTVVQTYLGPDVHGNHYYTNPVHMRVHPTFIQTVPDCEVETYSEPGMFKVVVILMLLILITIAGIAVK